MMALPHSMRRTQRPLPGQVHCQRSRRCVAALTRSQNEAKVARPATRWGAGERRGNTVASPSVRERPSSSAQALVCWLRRTAADGVGRPGVLPELRVASSSLVTRLRESPANAGLFCCLTAPATAPCSKSVFQTCLRNCLAWCAFEGPVTDPRCDIHFQESCARAAAPEHQRPRPRRGTGQRRAQVVPSRTGSCAA